MTLILQKIILFEVKGIALIAVFGVEKWLISELKHLRRIECWGNVSHNECCSAGERKHADKQHSKLLRLKWYFNSRSYFDQGRSRLECLYFCI